MSSTLTLPLRCVAALAAAADVAQFKPLFKAYEKQDKAEVWNIHISDKVVAPSTRRGITIGHGVR